MSINHFNHFMHKQPNNFSYLAVVAGLCGEADYIFIPEDPPSADWPQRLCKQLSQARPLSFYLHKLFIAMFTFFSMKKYFSPSKNVRLFLSIDFLIIHIYFIIEVSKQ